ncbi:uncharacterized protein LOC143827788 isoform X1 [Paroedura picta]|uniref:uncharacterized protein LOC143827788 isoform X1 n=1 Tax=Paroedura picta TaxID=143630 RepID=UPI0040572303
MGFSVVNRKVSSSDRTWAPSRRVTGAGRGAPCSAISSVSVAKRRRGLVVLAIVACLLTGAVAQREGSPVAPFQTPQGAREVPSSSSVSPRSTEAPWMVEPGLQTPPTDTQLHTVDPAVRTSGPSGDPIKASGLLISSSPEGKNRSEVLDPATSSWGVALAETDPSLGTPSKGLGESTDILQPGGSGEEGLFPTPSPTSPGLPDVGGSSRSTVTSSDTAVGFDHPKAAADFTSIQPPASEGGLAGEEDLPGTSQPLAYMAPTTHLGQKSTSHRGDVLPYAQTDFPAYQVVEDASVSPEMIRTSLSPPNLLLGTVPPEATRVVTDVFHSSRGVTAQSFSESVLRVSTGTSPASLPTRSPGVSSRSVTSIQEAVLNGQGPGVTEPATGSALGSPAVPAATARSSDWPFSSSSHTTLPDVVTQAAPMESEGLITHRLSRQQLVPTSVGSPELGDGTALSMSAHGAPATAEVDMEASPSRTSQMEISEAHSGVGEDTVPLASGSAMISPLASKETVGRLSTPQDFPGLEVSSGFFPGSSASFPATPAPRTDPLSSSWAARQMERGLTTQSPHLSPPVSPTVSFLRSAGPLGLERVAADNSTGAVLSTYRRATLGEGSPHLGSTSWARLPASLGTTEQQEGFPTTRGPSPGEGTGREQKERVSSTAEPSPDVSRHTSILDGPSLSTSLEVRSRFRPTETSSLLTLRAAPTAELTTDVPGHTSILDGHREPTRVDVSSKFHSTDASSLPTFMVSPTAEPSPDVPGHTSVLDVQNESTSLDVSSHVHPTDASSLPTFRVSPTAEPSPDVPEHTSILDGQSTPHDISSRFHPTDSSSRGVEIVYAIPSLPPSTSSSTFNALPSADVTDWGSHREATQLELHDGTGPITAATREGPEKISELPLSVSSLGSLSNITPALLGVPTAWKHPALSTERTSSTSSPPPGSILLTTPLSNVSTTVSRASLPSQLLDVAGAAQPFQTTAGGTHHVEEVIGSLSSSPKGELSNGTPVEWRLHLPTLSQAGAERTDGMETSRAIDASMGFSVRSTSYGRSSQASASRSYVETESAVMPQPNITQTVSLSPTATAVSPLSSTKDLQASSSIPPTTQAVSHPSSTEDLLASSRILPMTQAMSPSSFTNDLPASSSIPPTTQAVSLSSSAKDLLASSSILLTTQAVSSASSTTGLLASSSILPTTQAVSPSSSTKDLLATSRILPTMQAVSPSSSAKDLPASSSILPTTQVMSPSSSTKDLPASSSILPTTQAMSPSSSAKDLLASSSILPTTQAVSSASSTTGLPATSRILPTTQAVSPSSSAKDLPGSSSILPTTQAVTPSSSAKDLLASSSILPTTQAVTPSSSAKDLLASSSILPTTQAMSPSSSAKDLPGSSSILPTTQAVSPSSSAKDLLASSSILPTTQAVSSASSTTGLPASSRILPTTQAVSPSSSAKDLPGSSSILPTTQAMSPSSSAKVLPGSSSILPTTQAVTPSSSAKDLLASSSILPTTQAVSSASSTTGLPASSRILPTTQAVSPSSSAKDLLASSSILPTTQAMSPSSSAKVLPGSSSILPTTQAVSPSSSAKDLLASSSILPTTQAVSSASSTTGLPASSRILPTTQAVSPSSSAKDLLASSSILPTTQAMSPSSSAKVLPGSSSILPTTQAVSPSSSAKDLLASSSILPTTQAVSSTSSTTDLPASTWILPTTKPVSPASSTTGLPASFSIFPTTQSVSFTTDLPTSPTILPTSQAMSPSSSAKDLPASSSIHPTTQATSPSSSKDLPASSSILPTTQAISPSSSTTDLPASSRIHPTTQAVSSTSSASDPLVRSTILPTTQAVSPSSAKGPPASSSILPTTQAVSPSSSATDPQASSRIFPTVSVLTMRTDCSDVRCQNNTQPASFALLPRTSSQLPMTSPTLPPKTLVTTLGSTVGTIGTMGGSSKVDTQKDLTALTGTKPGSMTRDGPSSKHRVSSPRASTVGHTAERDNITLSRRMLGVSILSLDFHLTKIEYTESLANRSSARFKKLEGEVILTLNKMLSFYETFLRADVLRFLNGSVIAQAEALFRGEGLLPTPSDTIRTIVTAVEQREADAFDWQVDLKSLHCNGFGLENLDPEVLAISFTLLGEGSIATFGGLTDWGPLENLRNEVVRSLGARYGVQNFSLGQVRNVQGDLDINGDIYVDTAARVDVGWALEALKGLVKFSVDLGSICINGSKLSLQIFPISFLVTNRIFSDKLMDRSSTAHRRLSWDLSKALMHSMGQYKNLLQVTVREVRGGSLICYADVVFQPPAPTSKDLVQVLALAVGPKNYLGASSIQVDRFSFTVAGETLEPPFASPKIPSYGIALIVLSSFALIVIPFLVLLYKHLGWKEKMVIHRVRDPEVTVETFELENPTFRSLAEENSAPSSLPPDALG